MANIHDLIPIQNGTIGLEQDIPTVDGRHIWQWLGIRKAYSTWAKTQIDSLDFKENQHFIVYSLGGNNPQGGRPTDEYHFTLDAAKHMAMVSRTPKGHEARDYFIACEKAAKEPQEIPLSHGDLLVQMAEAYRSQERRLVAIEIVQQETQRQRLEEQAALILSQQQAIDALQRATTADNKADLALYGQAWLTIRQYCLIHGLEHQFPESLQQAYGTWLRGYCGEHNIPVYKANPADRPYNGENTYHSGTIQTTLMPWRLRREGQGHLLAIPTRQPVS
jgi:phage anti-repressor protein